MTNGMKLTVVGLGCFVGSVLRYAIKLIIDSQMLSLYGEPLAVLVANTLGCFLMGLFTAWVLKKWISPIWDKAIITGFCGGLTTFSSFAQGMLNLFQTGHILMATIYISANMLLGLAAVYAGLYVILGKSLTEMLVK